MSLRAEPIRVATRSDDEEGMLVFWDGRLIAVLVRLSEQHEEAAGLWFLEAGFGLADPVSKSLFDSVEEAAAWLRDAVE